MLRKHRHRMLCKFKVWSVKEENLWREFTRDAYETYMFHKEISLLGNQSWRNCSLQPKAPWGRSQSHYWKRPDLARKAWVILVERTCYLSSIWEFLYCTHPPSWSTAVSPSALSDLLNACTAAALRWGPETECRAEANFIYEVTGLLAFPH